MRVTIDGIRYDTAKAIQLATANAHPSDLHWYQEALYQKRRDRRFFLCGSGGALSHYNKGSLLTPRGSFMRIIPLTEAEAQIWAETMCPDKKLSLLPSP